MDIRTLRGGLSAEHTDLGRRFLAKLAAPNERGCRLWIGARTGKGYGVIRFKGRNLLAHRVAYLLFIGPLTSAMHLHHKCEAPACAELGHLAKTTMKEHILLGQAPAALNRRKTHCKAGHLFSPENTVIRKGGRQCRICERERGKAASERYRIAQGRAVGSGRSQKGERNPSARLNADQVRAIRESLSSGIAVRALARQYGVSQRTVQFIRDGRIWR